MRDAMVSFLTLLFVCLSVWGVISLVCVGVDFISNFHVSRSLAWFSVGFVTAIVKPWRPVTRLSQDVWSYLDDRISR